MTEAERLAAIEDIRDLKARYWRGVDTANADLVRSILAEDCVLDYVGCCTDPLTGVDHMPMMNVVFTGRDAWPDTAPSETVTVHHGHQSEIAVTSENEASGVWAFSDRFFLPPGGPWTRLTGFGHYHDTYARVGGHWLLKTTRIKRLWVETR